MAVIHGQAEAVVGDVEAVLLLFVVGHDIFAAAESMVGATVFGLVIEDAGAERSRAEALFVVAGVGGEVVVVAVGAHGLDG